MCKMIEQINDKHVAKQLKLWMCTCLINDIAGQAFDVLNLMLSIILMLTVQGSHWASEIQYMCSMVSTALPIFVLALSLNKMPCIICKSVKHLTFLKHQITSRR